MSFNPIVKHFTWDTLGSPISMKQPSHTRTGFPDMWGILPVIRSVPLYPWSSRHTHAQVYQICEVSISSSNYKIHKQPNHIVCNDVVAPTWWTSSRGYIILVSKVSVSCNIYLIEITLTMTRIRKGFENVYKAAAYRHQGMQTVLRSRNIHCGI